MAKKLISVGRHPWNVSAGAIRHPPPDATEFKTQKNSNKKANIYIKAE